VPYQSEIGRALGDTNTATDEDGFINTTGLILLMHFNNESTSGENDSLVKDFSVDVNSDRSGSVRNNGTINGAHYNFTDKKFGAAAIEFNGTGDYIDAGNDSSLNITAAITIAAWIKSNSEGYAVVKDPAGDSQITYFVDDSDCSGWTGDPCSDTDIRANNGAATLTCTYDDTLSAGVTITRVVVEGAHDYSCSTTDIDWAFEDTVIGTYTTNDCTCGASSHAQSFTHESPPVYNIGGTNTITLEEQGSGWASLHGGTFAGYAAGKMMKVIVDYNEAVTGKNTTVPFALSTINGGEFLIINDSNFYRANSSSDVNDGNWHHLAATFNGSEMRLYVDGSLEATNTSYSGDLPQNGYAVWIGRNYSADSPTGYFNGTIDEVALWNRTLSATEISNLYKRGALRLNLSVRSCDDASCSGEGWSEEFTNSSGIYLNETITPNNRYFQYKVLLHTNDTNFTPVLNDVTINYTTLGTDASGDYNFTFVAPSSVGTYTIKVNTTFDDINGENSINLSVNTPPNTPIINFPTSDLYTSLQPLDLNVTATDDNNDVLTISFYINGKLNQTSLTNTTFNASDGYYILNVSVSDNIEISANVTVNFTLDTINPNITLLLPLNNTGDKDGNITFIYNVTDTNNVNNCSLIINNQLNLSNASITRNIAQNFTLSDISVDPINWSINCTDQSNNIGSSVFRNVVVVPHIRFNGTTIDVATVDIRNITNLTLENSIAGRINFTKGIDLSSGADLNRYVNITSNRIEINSTAIPALNKSAILYLYNLTFTNPRILRDGSVCSSDICTKITYTDNTLKFNVTQFTVYSAEETPVAAEDEEEVTTTAGAAAAGGGGAGFVPTREDFSIDVDLIRALIKQGGTHQTQFTIENIGTEDLSFNIEYPDLDELLLLSDTEFLLAPGEVKVVDITTFAEEEKKPDIYSGNIKVSANNIKKSLPIIIEVQAKKALFDINVKVLPKHKNVLMNKNVIANITLINVGDLKPVDVELFYSIRDIEGNDLIFGIETLAVYDEISRIKELELPKNITFGTYMLYSRVSYGIETASAADILYVVQEKPASCFDNLQNQDEEGIDCGGSCKPCKFLNIFKSMPSFAIFGIIIIVFALLTYVIFRKKASYGIRRKQANRLYHFINSALDKGHKTHHIKRHLLSKGLPSDIVNKILNKVTSDKLRYFKRPKTQHLGQISKSKTVKISNNLHKQVTDYIYITLDHSYNIGQIKKMLQDVGWPEALIEKYVLEVLKQRNGRN
jgi:hypothetical protein